MTMDCQFCLFAEDWLSKDEYVVACGDYYNSKPFVHMIGVISEREFSELMRNKKVIEYEKARTPEDTKRLWSLFKEKYWGKKFLKPIKYNHEERIKLAEKISERISSDHIVTVYLVGSTAKDSDKDYSDLDMIGIRKYCPGVSACGIVEESKERYGIGIDIWCLTVADLNKLEEVNDPLVINKRLLYSNESI